MVSRTLSDAPGGLAISVQDTDASVTGLAVYTMVHEGQDMQTV